jgi:hypothetical protein
MAAATVDRVRQHTSERINHQIEAEIAGIVRWHAAHPERIADRLHELDEEWDIERTLQANASILAFTGTVLGMSTDRRWLALPAVVTAFLFQHAVQGWCPPVPILRRLGSARRMRSRQNGTPSRRCEEISAESGPVRAITTLGPAMPYRRRGFSYGSRVQQAGGVSCIGRYSLWARAGRILRGHRTTPEPAMAPYADQRGLYSKQRRELADKDLLGWALPCRHVRLHCRWSLRAVALLAEKPYPLVRQAPPRRTPDGLRHLQCC